MPVVRQNLSQWQVTTEEAKFLVSEDLVYDGYHPGADYELGEVFHICKEMLWHDVENALESFHEEKKTNGYHHRRGNDRCGR